MNKRIVAIIAITFITSFSSYSLLAQVAPLSQQAILRRTSLILRGHPATFEEMNSARSLDSEKFKVYLNQRIAAYQKDPSYISRMRRRLDDLFFLRQADSPDFPYSLDNLDSNSLPSGLTVRSALDQIFVDLFKKNMSWDQLLLNAEYTVYSAQDPNTFDDLKYYSYLIQNLDASKTSQQITLTDQQKKQTAGVVTTSRFFDRYPTTKLNKNRKRAAAVFRIFLCNEMRPVILPNPAEDEDFLRLALGLGHKDVKINSTQNSDQEKRHASDPTCQSCHISLDPMANTFRSSSLNLNSEPSPGGLVYRKEDGALINIPVGGLGELALAIVQQPEYTQCQVRRFWNWIIGEDVPLSPATLQELVKEFNRTGRKPNDFVSYLVQRPQFSAPSPLQSSDIRYSSIQHILRRCDSCHMTQEKAPQLSYGFPYVKNLKQNADVLLRVINALDLQEKNVTDYMPPQNAGWTLEGEERDLIKYWIINGARDIDGNITVDSDSLTQFKSLISAPPEKKIIFSPTFYDTYKRFLVGTDIPLSIAKSLLMKNLRLTSIYSCYPKSSQDLFSLGVRIPTNGRPLFKTPAAEYIRSVVNCLKSNVNYLTEDFSRLLYSDALYEFANKAYGKQKYSSQSTFKTLIESQSWSQHPVELKRFVVLRVLDLIIGNQVHATARTQNISQRIFQSLEAIQNQRTQQNSDLKSHEAVSLILLAVLSSEDYLSY